MDARYRNRVIRFKALGHSVRLQILEALAKGTASVGELTALTGRRQPYVSQQLAVLYNAGLISKKRRGLHVLYSLAKHELRSSAADLYTICCEQPQHSLVCQAEKVNTMSENKTDKWHGIPRTEIQWYPTIVADRCVGCGLCVTSCERGVYAFNYEANKPVVVAPEMCMVGCTTCATICCQDAIEFPSQGYIRQLIKHKKILRRSKDMLRANREKLTLP